MVISLLKRFFLPPRRHRHYRFIGGMRRIYTGRRWIYYDWYCLDWSFEWSRKRRMLDIGPLRVFY